MGATVGSIAGQGLNGMSQGLNQYGKPNPQFNFAVPKTPLGQGVTPNAKKPQVQPDPFQQAPNMRGNLYG